MNDISIDALQQQIGRLNSPELGDLSNFDTQEVFVSLIGAIAKAIELRDEYTSYHQENVAVISLAIGERLGLSKNELLGLRIGATIHDVGKIAVPAEVLNKTGKLNVADIAMMRLHPSFGGKIFEHVVSPWPLVEMIEQHHERMDGSGYPKRLKGDEIVLEARIIAVADTFDAMSSDRPYRSAPGQEAAFKELRAGSGKKYDARVVEALMSVVSDGLLIKRQLFGYAPN